MEHFSQDSCISASCIHSSSRGAPDEVDSACKTECATTTIMMPSCCKRLEANSLIPVGEIPFFAVCDCSEHPVTGAGQHPQGMLMDVHCSCSQSDCEPRGIARV